VKLLGSPFRANQARNTNYLLSVDLDRMLHTFRLNYGLPSTARPCGGWERPESQVRGHTTVHLLSALAMTYANTGNRAALAKGRHIVGELRRRRRWPHRPVPARATCVTGVPASVTASLNVSVIAVGAAGAAESVAGEVLGVDRPDRERPGGSCHHRLVRQGN
jgi:hypothetical protein